MSQTDRVFFKEEQKFRQPWLRGPLVLLAGLMVVLFSHALYKQLSQGQPWGSQPLPDEWLVVVSVFMFLLAGFLLWLTFGLTLTVTVDRANIHIAFKPFKKRSIPLCLVTDFYVRQYRPLREYGGWGIRWGGPKRGRAYNVRGNLGVQIQLADAKRVLIGSQRPEELAEAIAEAKTR